MQNYDANSANDWRKILRYSGGLGCCHIIEVSGYSTYVPYISKKAIHKIAEAMTWPAAIYYDNNKISYNTSSLSMVAAFPNNPSHKPLIEALGELGWTLVNLGKSNSSNNYDCLIAVHNAPTMGEQKAFHEKYGRYWSRYMGDYNLPKDWEQHPPKVIHDPTAPEKKEESQEQPQKGEQRVVNE